MAVTTPATTYAVLMGDLVQSEQAADPQWLHTRFNAAIADANRDHRDALASPLTITLGDEFQGLAWSLVAAAGIARDLRLALMADGIACRFVIGLTSLATPLNRAAAWNMMGSGLADARARLGQKRATSLYRFALGDPAIDTNLDALGAGLTAIERRWTGQQRADIAAALAGASPAEIARGRNVSVHSIYKVRSSGDFDAYLMMWHAVTDALAALDRTHDLGPAQRPATMEPPS